MSQNPPVRDIIYIVPPRLFGRVILAQVAEKHGLTVEEIKSQSRSYYIAHPRQEAMYEIRRHTKLSLPQIAQLVGLSDHTSVIHGIRAHERRMAQAAAERMAAE